MKNIRTDLALEIHEMLMEASREIQGVDIKKEEHEGLKISHIKIETKEAQKIMGKPVGNYITIEVPDISLNLSEVNDKISKTICAELKKLMNLKDKTSVLVAGLGNRFITPDSLGPAVISELMITRHLFEYIPEQTDENLRIVSAITPGVLGITGIETVEIVKGVADKIKPDYIIAIDALAGRNVRRIMSAIQITDVGISPGAGVGNNRKGLNKEFLGVPVIAIGIPTVIDAATITSDTIDSLKNNIESPSDVIGSISRMDEDERYNLIKEKTGKELSEFFATPKNVDILIEKASKIVANGINLALHKNIDIKDIDAYVS